MLTFIKCGWKITHLGLSTWGDPKLSSKTLVHGEESNGDLRGLSIFRHPYLELFIGDLGHFFFTSANQSGWFVWAIPN